MSNTKNLANLAAALDDGTSGQVLQSTGSGGVQFADSSGSGVTVHANQAAMLTDAASADEGTLHYENNTNKLYVKQSSGFYLLASITNASPTIDSFSENTGGAGANNLTAGGTFILTAGSNTVITINATEPDLETISYSATVTSGTATDVFSSPSFPVSSQSSNVFTLTPVTSGTGGTVTIRFDASDGTNVANVSHSFEIAFVIADSHYTTLLMATDGSAGNNQDDITDAAGNHTSNITVYGDAHVGTFSPYRHGGYSYEFDGSTDSIRADDHTDFDWSSNGFTIECWINMKAMPSGGVMTSTHQVLFSKWNAYSNNREFLLSFGSNGTLGLVLSTDGTNWTTTASNNNVISLNTWHHICYEFNGSSHIIYVDGTAEVTVNNSNVPYAGNMPFGIGYSISGGNTALHIVPQSFVTDVRVVNGSTVYGGAFTPPTERLTAVTNTKLLTCHLPYIADTPPSGGTAKTITVNGDPETKPIGPYDYDEYSESTNGGSVYLDGNSDYLDVSGSTSLDLDGTDWTIEGWVYRTGTGSIQTLVNTAPPHTTLIISLNRSGTGNTQVYTGNGSSWVGSPAIDSGSNYPLLANQWSHVAVVKSGTTLYLYHNGKQAGSTTTLPTGFTGNFRIGAYESSGAQGEYLNGYVSDFRVAKEAVYTGEFTPPSGPLTTTGGTYPSTTNVDTSITSELLLSGTDASIIDKSQGSNIKLVGSTNETESPYSSGRSINVTNAHSTYVEIPKRDEFLLGDTFTIEGWIKPTSLSNGYNTVFTANGYGYYLAVRSNGGLNFYSTNSGAPNYDTAAGVITNNTWHYIAAVCSSGTLTLYSGTSSSNFAARGHGSGGAENSVSGFNLNNFGSQFNGNTRFGVTHVSSQGFAGYFIDWRFSKGIARTVTFPSSPLKG